MGRDKRVTPMPEQTLLLGVSLNTKHLQEHPNNLAVTPAATPAVLPTSPNSSRRSPTACSTSPVATRASVTFFCIIAFLCLLSSLPGFLIQSALYVVLATSLLRMPLPTVLAGHLLYSAISFLRPICALFLLLPCLHKLHVRGQPLGDPASWGVRFTGSNAAWNQNVNYNHQY